MVDCQPFPRPSARAVVKSWIQDSDLYSHPIHSFLSLFPRYTLLLRRLTHVDEIPSSPTPASMAPKSPPGYILASLAISIGGLINGYDTGSIGAVISMSQFKASIGALSPTLVGFTVSLIMLAGAVPSVFAGWLADHHGRLKTILLGSVLFCIGALLQGTAYGLPQFLLGRTVAGLGEGVFLSNVSVYISEISPTKSRGVLSGLPQLMCTTGVCIGYFTCYGSVYLRGSSMAWRLPFIVMVAMSVVLIGCCARLPESPRWSMSRGDQPAALDALRRLDFSMVEAERNFMSSAAVAEQRVSLTPWQSFAILFRRGYRARTTLALFVLGMVQLSGIDGVLYVSTPQPEIYLFCIFENSDNTIVCTPTIFTGRAVFSYRVIPCIRRVWDSHAGDICPCLLTGRQVGTEDVRNYRRHRSFRNHVPDRFPLCCRCGASVWDC